MRQLELANDLRAWGLTVYEEPGWRTRGADSLRDIRGILLHHTAGPSTGNDPSKRVVRDGRPGLAGPLAQLYLARDGTWVTIASGIANHAGLGGPWKDVPRDQGNTYLLGVEAESTGYGDWTSAQLMAYPKGVAALLSAFGHGSDRAVAHKEWAPTRKIDPAGWPGDMGGFRATVEQWLNTGPNAEENDLTPEQDERLRQIQEQLTGSKANGEFPGFKSLVPGSDWHATLVDFVRTIDARLFAVEKDTRTSQAEQSAALTNIQAALQRLENK